MSKATRRLVAVVLALAALAHLLLFLDLPLIIGGAAALTLAALLPGILLVELMIGRPFRRPSPLEHVLYCVGAGYSIMVVVMLVVSYLPGGLERWQTLLAFDAVILGVSALLLMRRSGPRGLPSGWWEDVLGEPVDRRWLGIGLATLLVTAGFFRFANLGYAEFQGDEARAALRAAAVIQGYEDVLLIHKKGPTEILIPTAIYSLTGHLTEATARLPFAMANVAALFAVFLLGWRFFGPLAGWVAAMLLALDGYVVGFARIVQYQSVVLLTSALVVLILHRLLKWPQALRPYLSLAALLLATGVLSHYEGGLAALPAAFLLGVLFWRFRFHWVEIARAAGVAALVGAAVLALFYGPFILHPNFAATFTYLTARRIGGSFPYNNAGDFFLRSTVYNSSYFVLTLLALTVGALALAYGRGLGRRWGVAAALAAAAVLALTFWQPTWATVGGVDLLVAPVALLVLLPVALPRLRAAERTAWLWFGAIMVLALFVTEKPRTHVYTFFIPWMLLNGQAAAEGWAWLSGLLRQRTAQVVGSVAAAGLIALFGTYTYWYFVHNQPEVLRTWFDWHPAGYWVPYAEPDDKALFGFPLANGWKAVGALYDEGVLAGDYETNEKEAWVPAWYTQGQDRCGRSADWYFEIDNLEPFNEGDRLKMEHFLRQGFEKWAVVEVKGAPRMTVYKRTGAQSEFPNAAPIEGLPVYRLDEIEGQFDRLALPDLPLTYPTVAPPIGHPLHVNFGNKIWLEGYDIEHPEPLRQGDTIVLTLYWRSQAPMAESYKVFIQSYFGEGPMIAQLDGYPVCDTRETWRWDPGELITDVHHVPVNADAPDGLYPLYIGLYIEETLERLPVLDQSGAEAATQVHLTDIRVGKE